MPRSSPASRVLHPLPGHRRAPPSLCPRTFSTKSKSPKSSETTFVAPMTRFSEKKTQYKTLDTTFVVSKSKIDVESASKAKDKVVQIVMWVVDSGCSKHMTGLGHNLFSIGKFCDGDLEVAFRSNTCYVQKGLGRRCLAHRRHDLIITWDWLTVYQSSNMERIHLCLLRERGKKQEKLYPPKLVPNDHSKLELLYMDLCSLMRVALINGKRYLSSEKSSDIPIYFRCTTVSKYEDSLHILAIICIDTHAVLCCYYTSRRRHNYFLSVSLIEADEFNQADTAEFDGNAQFVPYNPPSREEIGSSTTALVPSNVQNFH
ncbi:hypothetical protein Tco_0305197 [Tanacetum coccineum]